MPCHWAIQTPPKPMQPYHNIENPQYYGGAENPHEAIKVIEAWELDFCLGNVLKYIARAGKKNPKTAVADLQKARWYLDRKIGQLSKEEYPPMF